MNTRQVTKYAIYIIAILSAALINEHLTKYVKKHIDASGYILVLIDMLVVILIFGPAFAFTSNYTKKISATYIKTSKKVSGRKNGILLGFIIALFILFILYAQLRHNIDVVQNLKSVFPF